ncbi:hypothetical protein ACFY9Q_15685 [Streptomyces sp. NPDC012389]|uniref:hypothetical protein n=1 Tax=unclassified Streptomyces TaxID=2593676 RepID=UPI00081D8A7F|nr:MULTISPECIES: hypothetical protein [unclassified Streptomyces]MYR93627.1 hypothetical protein [Streptomyces sp. SID4937]MYX15124.1 hypothetical protein [Streptomyces sp. SID8374]SCD56284.1 hypothetical protein GA0115243_103167 [Streptomyces sp. ScaeMP-e83]
MGEFLDAALGFPAVIFGAALVVVVCFWLLVLAGAADQHSFDSDLDSGTVGFGGVPVTVSVSLLVVIAWFGSLTGTVLVHRIPAGGPARAVLAVAVLAGSLFLAWGTVRLLAHLFRRYFPAEPPPSRMDFVGRVCTIRTGSVSAGFGQAEVAAADGSTAIVQVRQAPRVAQLAELHAEERLAFGSTGLLYAYDEEGEFFWVSPYDAALDPGPKAKPGGQGLPEATNG